MRTLIYKRTHNGDPDPDTGQFGIYDCMGRVRTWDFQAVIGVGGLSAKPKSLRHKVNWIGIGARKGGRNRRGPIVTFEHFLFFDSDGPNVPNFKTLAPVLARRIYSKNVRVVMNDLSASEQKEVDKILALAKHAPPSAGKTQPKSLKGC